ncbi:MAG: DoxX family protein [Prevotellaceae bacterium]|nr:DoxX family protein [Prevotellaceae bacterium]
MEKGRTHHTTLARISRLAVGLLLLWSAFTKAGDLETFINLLLQYGFPAVVWVAPVITVVEAAAGICLLLNIYPKQVSLFSAGMIAVFSLVFLYGYLFRNVTDCGCFGNTALLKLPPWATFVRNTVLLLLLFVSWRFPGNATPAARKKYIVALGMLLLASFFAGYTFSHKQRPGKVHPLYQRAVKETALPQLMHASPDSTYVVVIFSYRCDGCWNYFDNVKRYNDPAIADRLVVLSVGKDSTGIFHDYFLPGFEIREVDEKTVAQLTQVAPTLLYIAGDTVRHVVQGAIPTRYLFEKNYLEIH